MTTQHLKMFIKPLKRLLTDVTQPPPDRLTK